MTASLDALLEQLHRTSGPVLWLADESNGAALVALSQYQKKRKGNLTLISNRYDIVTAALDLELDARFSDFDLSELDGLPEDQKPQQVFYRISKERPVVNHVINSVFKLLAAGGEFHIAGGKNEGIKTYFKQGSALFGSAAKLKKAGNVYWGTLTKNTIYALPHDENMSLLNDNNYTQLRLITTTNGDEFFSKPGTYGWDKIDKGSEFLADQLDNILPGLPVANMNFLDLGCGYGYLTMRCQDKGFASITATDNNAAAIASIGANADHFGIDVTIVADDCAAKLTGPFDVIVCNPPFHQGFNVESALTHKFIQTTLRLLASRGRAFLVVNSFIPLEAAAKPLIAQANIQLSVLANNGSFKVIELAKQ